MSTCSVGQRGSSSSSLSCGASFLEDVASPKRTGRKGSSGHAENALINETKSRSGKCFEQEVIFNEKPQQTDLEIDGPEVKKRPVRPKDVLTLAGVVLSFPIRAATGVVAATLGTPVMLGSRAVRSVSKRLSPEKKNDTHSMGEATPTDYKGYNSRVILTGYPHQDKTGCIAKSIKVQQSLKQIDQVIDADAWVDSNISPNTLSGLTLQSRIDFIGHGSAESFAGIPANFVAKYLKKGGLKKVGVIRFDACSMASGTFMAELGRELEKAGIEFGWISGSRSPMGDLRHVAKFGHHTYTWSPIALPWQKFAGLMTPGVMDRKIIKGNANVDFKGTIYNAKKSMWRIASDYSPFH